MLADRSNDHELPTLPEPEQPQTRREDKKPRKKVLTDDPELVEEILRRQEEPKVAPDDLTTAA